MNLACLLCGQKHAQVEFLFMNELTGKAICSGCIDMFTVELAQQRAAKASLEAAHNARLIERAAAQAEPDEKGARG